MSEPNVSVWKETETWTCRPLICAGLTAALIGRNCRKSEWVYSQQQGRQDTAEAVPKEGKKTTKQAKERERRATQEDGDGC